jgi:dihydrofolate reductase
MKIALIVAYDEERGIGRDNDLMWHLPDDMKFFKEMTVGHIVVMGRKNYESIPEKYRPLPDRENVVLTRSESYMASDCLVFNNIEDVLGYYGEYEERTLFIIGGGEIYKLALEKDLVEVMYITQIHKTYGADTFFPEFNTDDWEVKILSEHPADEKHDSSFSILKYTKK